jgi:aromatic-L-amino-acid/L-tryptophan decarboxylase
MTPEEFRIHGHELIDWMADYMAGVEQLPVKPNIQPGTIIEQLPARPPDAPEPFERVFGDFRSIIVPGMTHWQHPSFFAYFPANNSPSSVLAEMLTSTLGAQCMSWATSPAATELEQRMMEWLRAMIGLPAAFTGVIQDTASTATLCAILTARERRSGYRINERGFPNDTRYTVYCSAEAHSSVEKAVKIAGIGRESLRKISVDDAYAMDVAALEEAVTRDIRLGFTPLCAVAAIGTTGSTAIDPVRAIAAICRKHGIWLHVDAAFAGSALILPECRWLAGGLEDADSFVFNPHKWMLTNFDCSAYFVRDAAALVRTFEILPEYLKTPEGDRVNNYRDWGIQLGRRFRALKLWFVIRTYGVSGLQKILRQHIAMAQQLVTIIRSLPDFELLAPAPLNVICFRYAPPAMKDTSALNDLNIRLHTALNADGRMFLTHTKLSGKYTLRLVIGQTTVRQEHVDAAWARIVATARELR